MSSKPLESCLWTRTCSAKRRFPKVYGFNFTSWRHNAPDNFKSRQKYERYNSSDALGSFSNRQLHWTRQAFFLMTVRTRKRQIIAVKKPARYIHPHPCQSLMLTTIPAQWRTLHGIFPAITAAFIVVWLCKADLWEAWRLKRRDTFALKSCV
jgi:hypothetical protein